MQKKNERFVRNFHSLNIEKGKEKKRKHNKSNIDIKIQRKNLCFKCAFTFALTNSTAAASQQATQQ